MMYVMVTPNRTRICQKQATCTPALSDRLRREDGNTNTLKPPSDSLRKDKLPHRGARESLQSHRVQRFATRRRCRHYLPRLRSLGRGVSLAADLRVGRVALPPPCRIAHFQRALVQRRMGFRDPHRTQPGLSAHHDPMGNPQGDQVPTAGTVILIIIIGAVSADGVSV